MALEMSAATRRAVIALSGGVDSAVAAYLAIQQGHGCFGVHMHLGYGAGDGGARLAADHLGIALRSYDLTEVFKKYVITPFAEGYLGGTTPNPCVDCNRRVKFGALMETGLADHSASLFLTGHYARIEHDGASYTLIKALDETKDQSYMLYTLTQRQLARIRFPLGEMTKADVRVLADKLGLPGANQPESQDLCFVSSGGYAGFIHAFANHAEPEGDFLDLSGNVLGRHKGLSRYTIGQRKGLGISAAHPLYVKAKNAADNTLVLCGEEGLYTQALKAKNVNWISGASPDKPMRVTAKVRYGQAEQWATATPLDCNQVCVRFDDPQRAVAPGQAVVLYQGDQVLGGGTIVA